MAESSGETGRTKLLTHDPAVMQLVADATVHLLAPFEQVEESLITVARIVLPLLGEWCFVNLVDREGALRQLDVVTLSPGELAVRLKRFSLFRNGFKETRPRILEIRPEWREKAAENSAHAELLRSFDEAFCLILPLQTRAELLGALIFVSSSRFALEKRAFAEELGNR